MKRFTIPIIVIIVIAGLVGLFMLGNKTNNKSSSNNSSNSAFASVKASPDGLPGLLTGNAPWAANDDTGQLTVRLNAIGLPPLTAEGTVLHIHQHLDIYVDGQKVAVPADIGIPSDQSFISVIHTHDTSGIIHVESPVQSDFYLGQFFDIWGVKFTKSCLGGYCATGDKQLTVYVNGQKYDGDPRQIKLASHQEIAVVYGASAELPNPLPSSYQFPEGY